MAGERQSNLQYLELATFVMTCARLSIEEDRRYAFIRVIDIFRWLADLPQLVDELRTEPIVMEVRSEIENARAEGQLETDEGRAQFTDKMVRKLVAHLKEKTGAQ